MPMLHCTITCHQLDRELTPFPGCVLWLPTHLIVMFDAALQAALSLACRLGFATRLSDTDFVPGGGQSDRHAT